MHWTYSIFWTPMRYFPRMYLMSLQLTVLLAIWLWGKKAEATWTWVMNGCDFEQKNVPLVPGGVKLILTFPENWVQTFPLYLEKKKDVKSTTYGKFSRGQECCTRHLEFSVMFPVCCTVQNVYSAVQAVDQQLSAGHKLCVRINQWISCHIQKPLCVSHFVSL